MNSRPLPDVALAPPASQIVAEDVDSAMRRSAYVPQAPDVRAGLRHQLDPLAEQVVAVVHAPGETTELLDLFVRVSSRVQA